MRIPIPLIFAAAVAVGAVVTITIMINVAILGSWDDRYASFNGTHVYQTGTIIGTAYKTLYLGYGTAYFQNPVSVYYLETVQSDSAGGARDLGRYLPIRVVVASGSLPTNTYISWRDPYGGETRRLYFVSGTNRGYVLGIFISRAGMRVNVAIPVYYKVEDSHVLLYPMERGAVATGEACNVVRNAGLGGTYNYVYAVLDNQAYDCAYNQWRSATVGWRQVASSTTSASLYPSPNYYVVSVTSGSSTLRIYLSYWYAIDADPGFFAVKPG
jgi:hypothetical protein